MNQHQKVHQYYNRKKEEVGKEKKVGGKALAVESGA